MIELIPIERETTPESLQSADENVRTVLTMTHALYARVGFQHPWICYLVLHEGSIVGSCGFTGPPLNGSVELAYFTFPGNEGKGLASAMCLRLTAIALSDAACPSVRARTLPERNASVHILEKSGFTLLGPVTDPEDGAVWEWEYQPSRAPSGGPQSSQAF